MKRMWAGGIFMLLIVGCSKKPMLYVNRSYEYDQERACISLLPLTKDALTILNRKDVHDDFKEDNRTAEEIIRDTSYITMFNSITDSIKKIATVRIPVSSCRDWIQDTVRFFTFQKRIGGDSTLISFNVLKKECLASLSSATNILIIINRMSISRDIGSSERPWFFGMAPGGPSISNLAGGGFHSSPGKSNTTICFSGMTPGVPPIPNPPGGGFLNLPGGSPSTIGGNVQYIIWDYLVNEPVSCGEFTAESTVGFAATSETWRRLFKHIGRRLAVATPFRGNKPAHRKTANKAAISRPQNR